MRISCLFTCVFIDIFGVFTGVSPDVFTGAYTGAKYSTTVSNCTAGLHLSCIAAGFQKGDEVIVPAQTHTATAHAVEFTGAKAVFADTDPLSANITPENILDKI